MIKTTATANLKKVSTKILSSQKNCFIRQNCQSNSSFSKTGLQISSKVRFLLILNELKEQLVKSFNLMNGEAYRYVDL